MHDPFLTLIGNVVDDPKMRVTKNGKHMTSFRIASTASRFDREAEAWVDNTTIYMNVVCYGPLAVNVGVSVHKGEPVLVTGRYQARNWIREEVVQTSYEIVADSVGHDLNRGTGAFLKVRRSGISTLVAVDDDGIPADPTDARTDLEPLEFEASPVFAAAG